MSVKIDEIKTKISTLTSEQEERVKTVNQLNTRIGEMKDGIAKLKEAHDYTRGQIEALQSLLSDGSEEIASSEESE